MLPTALAGTPIPGGAAIGSAIQTNSQNLSNLFGHSFTDLIAIVAGVILLAGAVFGFRAITTTVVTGAKAGIAAA